MKILSLAPSNTEILFELGLEDQLVATTSLCNYPKEAREKPSVGGWTNPKIDRVKKFEPDLIFASDDLQDQAVEELRDKNLEVVQVKPHSLEGVYNSILRIGRETSTETQAEQLVGSMKQEINHIDIENNRIYCEEWMDPPMVSGNWIPGLIEVIGGEYFIDEGRSREFDLDELKEFDPEYIFLNVCGAGENLSPDQLKKREEWSDITAIKEGNIYVIDDALLNRPGPRLVDGAKAIADRID